MQFVVENEAFAKALGVVKACVPGHNTMPILAHIVVEAKSGSVSVRATDLGREAEATVIAQVGRDGAIALPGEVLVGLMKRLPKGGQCGVEVADDRARIASGASKYDLRTLSAEDFPERKAAGPEACRFQIKASALKQLLASTAYAVHPNESRIALRGVHMHVDGKNLRCVATDGHRMAVSDAILPSGASRMPGVVVPLPAAQDFARLCETAPPDAEVEIAITANLIELRSEGVRLSSRLIDATFPAGYSDLIPQPKAAGAVIRPYALAEAVSRATVVYLNSKGPDHKVPVIEITSKGGQLALEAGIRGNELGNETVEADTNGHDLHFCVNADYLSEMLKVWPESVDVSVDQEDASKPVLFWADSRPDMRHLIMPCKR